MLQWLGVALGSPDALSPRGTLSPGLKSLLMIGSLSDVRRGIQVPVVCDTT